MPAGSHKYFEQSNPFGNPTSVDDPEFVAQVRAKLGPRYEDLVNEQTKSQAANIGDFKDPYNVLGYRVRKENFKTPEDFIKAKEKDTHLATTKKQLEDIKSPDKLIYGVGAGASPQTFAHEFRHEKIRDERENRLEDVLASNSPQQYRQNLEFLYEQIYGKKADKIPTLELEKRLGKDVSARNRWAGNKNINVENIKSIPVPWAEYARKKLSSSGILGVLPEAAQQYVERQAAMDRVEQPYLNFVSSDYDLINPDLTGHASGGVISLADPYQRAWLEQALRGVMR